MEGNIGSVKKNSGV